LRSYSFFLAFFHPDEKSAIPENFAKLFLKMHPAARILKPSRQRVEIACDGMSAWDSFDGARETRFILADEERR
jgi:hypothetical protein